MAKLSKTRPGPPLSTISRKLVPPEVRTFAIGLSGGQAGELRGKGADAKSEEMKSGEKK